MTYIFREIPCSIPSRDRLLALQLLLEISLQEGSLNYNLECVHLLLDLWDAGEAKHVIL